MVDYVYLSGKAKWFRVSQADQWGNFKTRVYLDPPSKDKFMELKKEGLASHLSMDEEGEFIIAKRPSQKVMKGRPISFAPPEILNKDGTTPLRDVNVGDGSDITCKLMVYEYRAPGRDQPKKKAMRLESVRIDNLVPFNKESFDPDTEKMVRGLDTAPQPNYNF